MAARSGDRPQQQEQTARSGDRPQQQEQTARSGDRPQQQEQTARSGDRPQQQEQTARSGDRPQQQEQQEVVMGAMVWPKAARKPRIAPEVRRDEYMTTVVIRFRRSWKQMGAAERAAVLEDGAAFLESVAGQMRDELSEIEIG